VLQQLHPSYKRGSHFPKLRYFRKKGVTKFAVLTGKEAQNSQGFPTNIRKDFSL
jgi:hypothetical protein